MEFFQRIDFFADTNKFDRLAGDRAHREGSTAAGIAVHAGEHNAGEIDLVREILCDIDRVLTGQCIDHEQDFLRFRDIGNRLHLVHQLLIDMQTTGGIE